MSHLRHHQLYQVAKESPSLASEKAASRLSSLPEGKMVQDWKFSVTPLSCSQWVLSAMAWAPHLAVGWVRGGFPEGARKKGELPAKSVAAWQ
jgi:hypothetical protein